jgi:hypothetical protein
MANLSRTTRDHEEIRRWAEERGGKPAHVKSTGSKEDIGILRIDFPGFSGEKSLEPISWEDFFEKFDDRNLSLIYQEETAGGQRSNFNKLISAETAAEGGAGRSRGARGNRKGAGGSTSRSRKTAKKAGKAAKKAGSARKAASSTSARSTSSAKGARKRSPTKAASKKAASSRKAPKKSAGAPARKKSSGRATKRR